MQLGKLRDEWTHSMRQRDLDKALSLCQEHLSLAQSILATDAMHVLEARRIYTSAVASAQKDLAVTYAQRREADEAMRHLNLATAPQIDRNLIVAWLEDERFSPISDDPRFLGFYRKHMGKDYEIGADGDNAPDCDLTSLPRAKERSSLAVLDCQVSEDLSISDAATLADICRQAIQDSQRFKLVDREHMRELLSEEDMMLVLDCDNTQCMVDYGKKLRAQMLVIGRVNRVGKLLVLSVKMLDVGSASVIAMKTSEIAGALDRLVEHIPRQTCLLLRDSLAR